MLSDVFVNDITKKGIWLENKRKSDVYCDNFMLKFNI